MATYLYGLTLANSMSLRAPGTGVTGSAVKALSCGELTAIVSELSRSAVRPSLDTIAEHDRVLQRFVDEGATIAAVRFGQLFDDDESCCRSVIERADRVIELLRAQEGAVEMRVLLPHSEPDVTGSPRESGGIGPGRAYLESLRGVSAAPTGAGLREALGSLVRVERVEALPQSRGTAFVHLVNRVDVGAYRAAVQAVPGFSAARVVGPLPFYSFAELS